MKNKKLERNWEKYAVLVLLVGFGLFSIIYSAVVVAEKEIEIVDCYDRYGNKIIGEKCLEEPNSIYFIIVGIMAILIGVFLFIIMKSFEESVSRGF